MALKKIQVKTGMNRENTNYAGEGGYWSGDKIRFRSGYAEKIGGWITNSANSFAGVCRSLFEWVTLSSESLVAVGTNQRYYVQNNGTFYPITPLSRTVTLGTNPFTTVSGSNLVTVTDAGFASTAGSFVTFSGSTAFLTLAVTGTSGDGTNATITFAPQATAPTVGDSVTIAGVTPAGYNGVKVITASTTSSLSFASAVTGAMTVAGTVGLLKMNGSYEIITTGSGTYTIYAPGASSSTSGGGSAVVAKYDIPVSSATYAATSSAGWGISPWGSGDWGTSTGGSVPLALWSQSNWGQDLVFAARSGAIYYWGKDTTTYAPATTINAYAETQQKTYKLTAVFAAGSVTVSDTIDIDVGAAIYHGSISPANYVGYVDTSWNGSTTVTIGGGTGFTSASATAVFSYSGNNAPKQINQIVIFSTYQFIVALGSTPYDPTAFGPAFNPMLVRWSDQSIAAEWTPTTFNQSGEVILANGSYIVGGTTARQELLIWTDKALYSMQYIGAPYVFNFQTLMDNISIMSPNAMITVNNITYWMGVDKFYVYSGTVQPLPCTIRQYVFNNLNFSQSYQVICGHNEEYSEVWWHYPSTSSNTNDSYVIWNYADNNWYFGTMNRTAWYDTPLSSTPLAAISVQNSYLSAAMTATATQIPMITSTSYPNSGVVIIDNEQIAYTSNGGTFLSGLTRGYNNTTAASHTIYTAVTNSPKNQIVKHEVGYDDGSVTPSVAIPAYIETSDFDIEDGEHLAFVSRIIPDLTFEGSSAGSNPQVLLTLKPRYYPGYNYDESYSGAVDSNVLPPTPPAQIPVEQYTGVVFTRLRGRQIAFRVESVKKGTSWQLGLMRFDIRPDGRR
jgi:hypothetical protein